LVPDVWIVIRASTYVFVAGPDPFGPEPIVAVVGSVSRVTVGPLVNVKTAVPLAVKTPVTFELIVTVQVAVLPPFDKVGDAQVSDEELGAGLTEGVIATDVGTTEPRALAVIVKVCSTPTWFVADGVIAMLPSTQVLTLLFVAPGPCGAVVDAMLSRVRMLPWTSMSDDTRSVAVPAVLMYRHYRRLVDDYLVEMEEQAERLLERVYDAGGRA
jgi:hypothetical protein